MPTLTELMNNSGTGDGNTPGEVQRIASDGNLVGNGSVSLSSLMKGSSGGINTPTWNGEGIQLNPQEVEKYDFPIYPGQDPNETAALNQTAWDLTKAAAGNFLGSFVNSIGATAGTLLAGIPTIIGRGASGDDLATSVSGIYDNPINKVFNDFQKNMQEWAPVYKTKELEDAPWYKYMLSPEFLASDAASGAGYFAGAYVAGLGLVKGVSAASKYMPGTIRSSKDLFGTMNGMQGAVETGANLATPIAGMKNAVMAAKVIKNPNIGSQFAVAMTMAAGEASAESNGVKERIREQLKKDREDGKNVMSDEQIESEASRGGNVDFFVNLPLVAATDMLMFGRSLTGSFEASMKSLAEQNAKKMGKQIVEKKVEKGVAAGLLPEMELAAETKGLDRLKRLGEGFLTEGSQEWGQYIAGEASADYYSLRNDPEAKGQVLGLLDSYMNVIGDKAFSKEAIISTLLGGLMGGPAQVAMGRGERKADRDNAIAALKTIKEFTPEKIAEYSNTLESLTRIQALNNKAGQALDINDEMLFRTFKHSELMAYVRLAEEQGVGEMLVERIKKLKDAPADKMKTFFNMNDKIDLTEEEKNKRLDNIISRVNEGRQAHQDLEIRWGVLPKAVKDTLYDAMTSIENLDNRQKSIAEKIQSTIGLKFPGLAIPFDFNEYMTLAAQTESEGGETIDGKKETVSTWKQTAKDWVESIKNSNPEAYQEIRKDLNDLFRISDLREVYVKNFNEALKSPEKFNSELEKKAKMINVFTTPNEEDDEDFYNSYTYDDTIGEQTKEEFGRDTGVKPNVYLGPPKDKPWEGNVSEANPNEVQPKLSETKSEKYSLGPDEGWNIFGFVSAEIEAEPLINFETGEAGAKLKLKIKKKENPNDALEFYDEEGNTYSSGQLKNITVVKTARQVREDLLNDARRKVIEKDLAAIKNIKSVELDTEIESLEKTLLDIEKDLGVEMMRIRRESRKKTGRKAKMSAIKASAVIIQLENLLTHNKKLLAEAIDQKAALEKRRIELEADLTKTVSLEELSFMRGRISLFKKEIVNKEERIETLKKQPVIIEGLIKELKDLLKGAYTTLYNIYRKTYNTAPQEDQKAFIGYTSLLEGINKNITEAQEELKDYPESMKEAKQKEIDEIIKYRNSIENKFLGKFETHEDYFKLIKERDILDREILLNLPSVSAEEFLKGDLTERRNALNERIRNHPATILEEASLIPSSKNKILNKKIKEIDALIEDAELELKIHPADATTIDKRVTELDNLRKQQRALAAQLRLQEPFKTIPLPVKQKIQHLIEAGNIPANIVQMMFDFSINERGLETVHGMIKVLEKELKDLQQQSKTSQKFYDDVIAEIKGLRKKEELKLKPKKDLSKPDSVTTKKGLGQKVQLEFSGDKDDMFPDGNYLKSIWDIFSTTSAGDIIEGNSDSQKRWLAAISKLNIKDGYTLKLVSPDSNPELFTEDKNDPNLIHATDENGKPTIGVVLFKGGFPVGEALGSLQEEVDLKNPEKLIYTTLHQPKFERTNKEYGKDKFYDALDKDGEPTKDALEQMELYQEFYNNILKQVNAKEDIQIKVDKKSNGIFEKFEGKRDGKGKDTSHSVETLLGKDYDSTDILIATDAAGEEIIDMASTGNSVKLKRGYPYLELANGNILPLLGRNITEDEAETIFELLKLASIKDEVSGKNYTNFDEDGNYVFGAKNVKEKEPEKDPKVHLTKEELKKREEDSYTFFKVKYENKKPIIEWYNNKTKQWIKTKVKGKDWTTLYEKIKKESKGKPNVGVKIPKLNKKSKSKKTKAKEKAEVNSNVKNVFNYLKTIIYYGNQLNDDGSGTISNPNQDTIIFDTTDKTTGKQYLIFPDKSVTKESEMFGRTDKEGKFHPVEGMRKMEFTEAEFNTHKKAILSFLQTKIHNAQSVKKDNKPYYSVTSVDPKTKKLTIVKWKNYKDYLIGDTIPGQEAHKRPTDEIPLTSPLVGTQIHRNMWLGYTPKEQIGKRDKKINVMADEEGESTASEDTTEDDAPNDMDDETAFYFNQNKKNERAGGLKGVAEKMMGKSEKKVTPDKIKEDVEKLKGKKTPVKKGVALSKDDMDPFAPGTKITYMEALDTEYEQSDWDEKKENLRKILPQVSLQRIYNKLINERYFGYASEAGITLSDLAVKGAEYHEGFHIVSRGILTPEEREILYTAAVKVWGVPTVEQIENLSTIYPNQSNEELVESFYEEKLAEAFRHFMLTDELGGITEITSIPGAKGFFTKLFDRFKNFINSIVEFFGKDPWFVINENTKPKVNEALWNIFKDIKAGQFADKPIKNFKQNEKRYAAYTENISARLNHEVLSYVTMKFLELFYSENPSKNITSLKNEQVGILLNRVLGDTKTKLKEQVRSLQSMIPDATKDEKQQLLKDIEILNTGIDGLEDVKSRKKADQQGYQFTYSRNFKTAFNKYLELYGFQFRQGETEGDTTFEGIMTRQDEVNSTKSGIDLGGGKHFVEISNKDTASHQIKLLIASIPATVKVKEYTKITAGKNKGKRTGIYKIKSYPKLGKYGLPQPVDWRTTWSFVSNELAGLDTLELMMNKLNRLQKVKPDLKYLYDILKDNSSETYYFKKVFQQAFYNSKPKHITYLVDKKGKIYEINSVIDTAQRKIKEKWVDNLNDDIAENPNSIFIKSKSGKVVLAMRGSKYVANIIKDNLDKIKKTDKSHTIEEIIQGYAVPLGINFSDISSLPEPEETLNTLRAIYDHIVSDGISTPDELIFGKEYSKKKNISQTSRIDFLAEQELNNTLEEISHEFRGPDGELRYALHKPNLANKITDSINQVTGILNGKKTYLTRAELFVKYPHLNTFATQYTHWFKLNGFLYDKNGNRKEDVIFDSSIFTGIEDTESDFGETTTDVVQGARLAMFFNAGKPSETSKNKTINLSTIWNSDKGLSNGFLMSQMFEDDQFSEDADSLQFPEEVMEQFTNYLKYDFERNKKLLHEKLGIQVQHYSKKAGQLGIFNMLFKSNPLLEKHAEYFIKNNYNEKDLDTFIGSPDVQKLLAQFILDKIQENRQLLTEYKIIKPGDIGSIVIGSGFIDAEVLNQRLANFTVSNMISYYEQLLMLTGDANFYKSILEIFKRVSGFLAPKYFGSMSEYDNTQLKHINKEQIKRFKDGRRDDGKMPDGFINTLALNDISIEKFDLELIRTTLEKEYEGHPDGKRIVSALIKKYQDINEADGMGIMTLPEYREWKQRIGEWDNDKMQKAYDKAMGTWNPLTQTYDGGQLLNEDELVYFKPEKLHIAGFLGNDEFVEESNPEDRLAVPVLCKFCIFPVIPSVQQAIGAMSTEYFNAAMQKGDNSIGMFVFAPKVGAVMQEEINERNESSYDLQEAYTINEEEENAHMDPESIKGKLNLMKIPYNVLGMQVKTKSGQEKEGVFGVQVKKVVQGNLTDKGEYIPIKVMNDEGTALIEGNKEITKTLLEGINSALTDLLIYGQDQIIKDLGLEELPAGPTEYITNSKGKKVPKEPERKFKVVNWKKTIDILNDRLTKAGISEYILDTIDVEKEKSGSGVIRYTVLNPLDAVVDRNRIESSLMALINKTVLKPHVVGGSRIMSSVIMVDDEKRSVNDKRKVLTTDPDNPEGYKDYRIGKHGETLAAQIAIPLPEQYRYLLKKYKTLNALNDAIAEALDIENRYKPEHQELIKLITVIAYRIPTQGLNSVDFFEIKKFLAPELGSVIYAASEIVTKTGGDFDVDKLNFIFPSWHEGTLDIKFDGKGSDFPVFMIEYLQKKLGKELAHEFQAKLAKFKYEKIVGKHKGEPIEKVTAKGNVIAKKFKPGKPIYETYEGSKGILYFIAEQQGVLPEGFTKQEVGLIKNMADAYIEEKRSEIKPILHSSKEIYGEALKHSNLYEIKDIVGDIKGAAINRFIEATIKILSSPDMFGDLKIPNNTVNLTPLSLEVEEAFGIPNEKNSVDRGKLLSFAYHMKMGAIFLAGKAGVGGVVLQQNNHILAQQANLTVNPKYQGKIKDPNTGRYEEVTKSSDMYFDGFKNNQDYSLGAVKDIKNGNKILNVISEYINGYVDAIKDTFIFSINAGRITQQVHMYLIRRRVPLKSVVYFMNQPVIRDYVAEVDVNKNQLLKDAPTDDTVIDNLIKFYADKMPEGEDLSNMYFTEKELNDAMRTSLLDLPYMSETAQVKYYKIQLQTIKNFKDYNEQAKMLMNTVKAVAIDTHQSKSLEENYVHNYISKNAFNDNLINAESLNNLIENTYLSIYKKANSETNSLLSDMFITSDPVLEKLTQSILHPYLDNEYIPKDKQVSIAQKIKTEVLSYIFLTYPSWSTDSGLAGSISDFSKFLISDIKSKETENKPAKFYDDIRKLITIRNKYFNEERYNELIDIIEIDKIELTPAEEQELSKLENIKRLKEIYEGNSFLKELVTVIDDKNFKTEGLKMLNKKRLPYEQDVLIEDFMNLLTMNDVFIRKGISIASVAEKIMFTAILQSGISYSPYSFINKLDPARYSKLIGKVVIAFKNEKLTTKAEKLSHFKDQFFRNNYKNNTLVPNVRGNNIQIADNELRGIENYPKYHGYEYLKTWDENLNDYRLYKAQVYDSENEYFTDYMEIPKLGDDYLFKEYKGKAIGYSQIERNNIVSIGNTGSKQISLEGLVNNAVESKPVVKRKKNPVTMVDSKENIVAIIGTAGRKQVPTLKEWKNMLSDAENRISSENILISGGAAFADHIAVKLFLEGKVVGLKLRLPAPFKNGKFEGDYGTSGGTANYYHEQFSKIIGENTLAQIQKAIDKGAEVTYEPSAKGYAAMKIRNSKVATESGKLLAYTYGETNVPMDGGTKDTWDKHKGNKTHIPITKINLSKAQLKTESKNIQPTVEKIKFDSLTKEEQYNVKYKHRKTAAVFNAATAERQQFWKTC